MVTKFSKFSYKKEDVLTFQLLLKGWHTLQEKLGSTTNVSWCRRLLSYEIDTLNRPFIVSRITSRIVKLTGEYERKQIDEYIKNKKSKSRQL